MILKTDATADRLSRPDDHDPLIITPSPNLSDLASSGSASLDLRLGTWFLALRQAKIPYLAVSSNVPETQLTTAEYVPFGKEYYLHPRSFVLGVALEWIRLPSNLAGYVTSKSSWGRRGLVIATATGVHPGFKGCLTLELTNLGEIPIALKPGMQICQIFLHSVEESKDAINTEKVDQSSFAGARKPKLGKVKFADRLSQVLSDPYSEKM